MNNQNNNSDPATRVIVADGQAFTGIGIFTVTQTWTRTDTITSVGTSPITGIRGNGDVLSSIQSE